MSFNAALFISLDLLLICYLVEDSSHSSQRTLFPAVVNTKELVQAEAVAQLHRYVEIAMGDFFVCY